MVGIYSADYRSMVGLGNSNVRLMTLTLYLCVLVRSYRFKPLTRANTENGHFG